MSETKSLDAPKASIDRRAIVKGVAWTLPVISLAIAAPAAAASVTPSANLTGTYSGSLTPNNKTLSAPGSLDILNTGGATAGSDNVLVTVTITRTAGSPGIFITSLGQSAPTTGTGTAYATDVLTATFTIPVTRNTVTQSFALAYSRDGSGNTNGSYSMTVSVQLTTGLVSATSTFTLK